MPMTPPTRCPHCHGLLPSGRGAEWCGCVVGRTRRERRKGWHGAGWDEVPAAWKRAWKKVRDSWIAEHPFCVMCGCVATEVDHIKGRIALKTITDLLDISEIQSLCKNCHKRKTYSTRIRGETITKTNRKT